MSRLKIVPCLWFIFNLKVNECCNRGLISNAVRSDDSSAIKCCSLLHWFLGILHIIKESHSLSFIIGRWFIDSLELLFNEKKTWAETWKTVLGLSCGAMELWKSSQWNTWVWGGSLSSWPGEYLVVGWISEKLAWGRPCCGVDLWIADQENILVYFGSLKMYSGKKNEYSSKNKNLGCSSGQLNLSNCNVIH